MPKIGQPIKKAVKKAVKKKSAVKKAPKYDSPTKRAQVKKRSIKKAVKRRISGPSGPVTADTVTRTPSTGAKRVTRTATNLSSAVACRACLGTGWSTAGHHCFPCRGTGRDLSTKKWRCPKCGILHEGFVKDECRNKKCPGKRK